MWIMDWVGDFVFPPQVLQLDSASSRGSNQQWKTFAGIVLYVTKWSVSIHVTDQQKVYVDLSV